MSEVVASTQWRRLGTTVALLIVCSLCLYLPALFHEVFADDEIYLAYTNNFLRKSGWSDLYLLLIKPANPWEYLPLRDFTYWLDFRIYGDEPGGFHLTNILWYALSAFAVGWLCREALAWQRPGQSGRTRLLALCGVAVFLVHPAHVEAVAWIAARKDLIAGTLGLMAAALMLRSIRHEYRLRDAFMAAAFLFTACFGKAAATALVIFLTVVVGAGWRLSPRVPAWRKTSVLLLLWAIVAFASFVHLQVGESYGIRIVNHPGFLATLERASRILTQLNWLLIFPADLGLYHDAYAIGDWHWLTSAGILIATAGALYSVFRRRSTWGLGIVLIESPLIVYLQFIPFTTWSLVSERFLFVPVAGLVLVMIDVLDRLGRPKAIVALLFAVFVPSALMAWNRIAVWEYGIALQAREYERQPLFHNAIRDRIMFNLLEKQGFTEARQLAQLLDRDYARESMLALIETEQAYQRLRRADDINGARKQANAGENTSGNERKVFCDALALLQRKVDAGYARIPTEEDISYNNLLRSQERDISVTYSSLKKQCI